MQNEPARLFKYAKSVSKYAKSDALTTFSHGCLEKISYLCTRFYVKANNDRHNLYFLPNLRLRGRYQC